MKPTVKKADYNNRKLTEEARARLQKKLDNENKKETMLYKFDNQPKKGQKKKSPKPSAADKAASAAASEKASAKAETPSKKSVSVDQGVEQDDEVDTPPRNKIARARKAKEKSTDVNWISIIKYNQKDAQREEISEEDLERKARLMIKQGLDEQCAIRKAARVQEQKDKVDYNRQQREKFARWAKEKKDKMGKNVEKSKVLKGIRVGQCQELHQRRVKEERKIKVQEAREVKRLQEEIQKEKERQRNKKVANREVMKQMIIENEAHKKKVMAKEEEERKEAVELQQQYAKILEKQETERNRRLRETYEMMQKKEVALLDATAGDREAERIAQEKAERERKLYDDAELAKEKAKKDKLRADQESCNVAIAQQIKDKEARIKKEKEDDIAYGKRLLEISLKEEEKEQDKLRQSRDKMKTNLEYLSMQVADFERRKSEGATEISTTEKKMNAGLLNQIKTGKVEGGEPIAVDPKMPFAWRYNVRKCPF